ncbi:hypothetical protein PABY_19720 [Pyrodictium abyssi]|uniref:Uncharacterized protein n=1 Tax=Pyrodictium abyssi TaxID=54256 RepID=A0ABN6ZU28_9CREN|nr:hypothetical protein PABY_19720 [Pyrodictium abyssi]
MYTIATPGKQKGTKQAKEPYTLPSIPRCAAMQAPGPGAL